MWSRIASIILRNRILMLTLVVATTGFWGYLAATKVKLNHSFATMLPEKDTLNLQYQELKKTFGEDGMVMVIGIQDPKLYTLEHFNQWRKLGKEIRKIEGVDSVFSVAHLFELVKDDSLKRFFFRDIAPLDPTSQADVDSIHRKVLALPFYKDFLYNDSTGASLMMVFINAEKFNSENRGNTIGEIIELTKNYEGVFPDMYFSGMPFIRDTLFHLLKNELRLFVFLSALVTALIIFSFFRSFRIIAACMLVVVAGVVWSFGTMGLFQFEVSQLMALVPPLMIVIAIPNCIYLITKFHQEFLKSGNKYKALHRTIEKIGVATFMTNATTAIGFFTFILTKSDKMIEFGVIASLNVLAIFFLSIILIPITFSFMPEPSVKHTKHLERNWVDKVISALLTIVDNYRKWVYIGVGALIVIAFIGVYRMQITGSITEDMPENSAVVQDLKFIEKNFGGVVPFEVIIDFKKKGQLQKDQNLKGIQEFQEALSKDTVFSKSLSLVDAIKFVNQAFYSGNPDEYQLISRRDAGFIKPYLDNLKDNQTGTKGFIDSTGTKTRVTIQIKDLGAKELDLAEARVLKALDTIFNPEKPAMDSLFGEIEKANQEKRDTLLFGFYEEFPRVFNELAILKAGSDTSAHYYELDEDLYRMKEHHAEENHLKDLRKAIDETSYSYYVTGTSVVYAKGTGYLITNLVQSLIFAVIAISILMALLFRSFRMVGISLLPNIIPLLITAAVMGYFNIPIKPSTVLVFSIALGISVDDAIHYLAKYRQELKLGNSIGNSAKMAIKEAGVSMIYTSIVLFFGFLMFTFSEFGGTIALGLLISLTLIVAMFCNLIILPTLLMSLDNWITTKAFKEPYMEIFDEEIDEDLAALEIEKPGSFEEAE